MRILDQLDPRDVEATKKLHSEPCPGCGSEPEVSAYIRRRYEAEDGHTFLGIRCGYDCNCGATVIDGVVQGYGSRG